MSHFILLAITHSLAGGAGAYLWNKYKTKVAAAEAALKK